MATPTLTWYPLGVVSCWSGATVLPTETVKALILDNSYSYDKTHEFVNDVVAAEHDGSGYSRSLCSGVAVGLGGGGLSAVVDLDDTVFPSVGTGTNPVRYVAVYAEVTDDTDSPLLFVMDIGQNITPAGALLTAAWPTGGVASIKNQTASLDPDAPSVFQAVEGESNGTSWVTMLSGIAGGARVIRSVIFHNAVGAPEGVELRLSDGTNDLTLLHDTAVADKETLAALPTGYRFTLPDENWSIAMRLDGASGTDVNWYVGFENG